MASFMPWVIIFISLTMAAVFQSPSAPNPYPFSMRRWIARPGSCCSSPNPQVGDDGVVILLQQELLKASLNLGLYRHMALKFLRIPALQQDSVLAVILVHQCRDVSLWHSLHIFGQLIDRIGVHFPAELHLGLHLVAFGDSHIPHVVRKSRHPYMAALHDAYRGAHPGCYAAHHLSSLQWPTITFLSIPMRVTIWPYSLSPWADWFSFMKSMSMES